MESINELFTDSRPFARACQHYYRVVLHQNAATATLNTRIELAQARLRIAADPHARAVAAGVFGYRALADHPLARELPVLPACGIAYDLAARDEAALDALVVAIAECARAAGHTRVVVVTTGEVQLVGVEPSRDAALLDRKYAVGVLDLARCETRIRMFQRAA
jgi:hypothetical protein